jgi:phosphatidylglycerophosphatase A
MSTEPALNPPLRGAGRKPDWRFLLAHPAHVVALGFGSGLSPVAPGTAGTLFAWLAWAALPRTTSDATVAGALCRVPPQLVGRHRHRAAPSRRRSVGDRLRRDRRLLGVLWLVSPAGFWGQATRSPCSASSMRKPGPVAWADQRFKLRRGRPLGWAQGFGILFDDFVRPVHLAGDRVVRFV